ncbi:MAG: AI-2E family transporter [bacterium]|nr:AI-2E family transporter [bacterium]
MTQYSKDPVITICLVILCAIAVTAALYVMRPVMVPFVFSLFIYFLLSPIIDWLHRRLFIPKYISISLALLLLVSLCTMFVMVLGVSLKGFIKSSTAYQQNLLVLVDNVAEWMSSHGYIMDLSFVTQFLSNVPVIDWIRGLSGGVFGIVGNLFLVLIFTFFLVVGSESSAKEGKGFALSQDVKVKINRYLGTKLFTSFLTGMLVMVLFSVFGVDLAFMFASFTFFLNFIPNIGSIIAIILPIPVLFLQFGASWETATIISIMGVIQFSIGNILDPKLMGVNLGLHPVIILLSLLFWGFIWGVSGMFLSAPITAIVKLILDRYERTKPIGNLLAGRFN